MNKLDVLCETLYSERAKEAWIPSELYDEVIQFLPDKKSPVHKIEPTSQEEARANGEFERLGLVVHRSQMEGEDDILLQAPVVNRWKLKVDWIFQSSQNQ